ncbi:outer membrane lipoprotein carrier protein LolA [Pseudomonas sp. SH1-B]
MKAGECNAAKAPNCIRATRLSRIVSALLFTCLTSLAHAFSLDDLSTQLSQPQVVRGDFIQEKHLRALPQPLTSRGNFVLAREQGLLWLLASPLRQDYRIDAQGIARRTEQGWQRVAQQSATAQQNRLFLAVLKGDSSGLREDFELSLSGNADAWQLELTPRSVLLKQVFSRILIDGGELVQRIELQETQGDSTVLRLENNRAAASLSDAELHDFQS